MKFDKTGAWMEWNKQHLGCKILLKDHSPCYNNWLAEKIDKEVECTMSEDGTHMNYALEKDCEVGLHRGKIKSQRINLYLSEE